jgi:hypothetical protein
MRSNGCALPLENNWQLNSVTRGEEWAGQGRIVPADATAGVGDHVHRGVGRRKGIIEEFALARQYLGTSIEVRTGYDYDPRARALGGDDPRGPHYVLCFPRWRGLRGGWWWCSFLSRVAVVECGGDFFTVTGECPHGSGNHQRTKRARQEKAGTCLHDMPLVRPVVRAQSDRQCGSHWICRGGGEIGSNGAGRALIGAQGGEMADQQEYAYSKQRAASLLLSFVAGYVDSCTFLALFGLFVAQVTGSFVVAGAQIARSGQGLLVTTFAIPMFVIAGAATTLLVAFAKQRRSSPLVWSLALEGALLTGFLVLGLIGSPFQGPNAA